MLGPDPTPEGLWRVRESGGDYLDAQALVFTQHQWKKLQEIEVGRRVKGCSLSPCSVLGELCSSTDIPSHGVGLLYPGLRRARFW